MQRQLKTESSVLILVQTGLTQRRDDATKYAYGFKNFEVIKLAFNTNISGTMKGMNVRHKQGRGHVLLNARQIMGG
ncbi:MAG: hypothetical protein PHF56_11940 [Desulfuromonadaceae bacterium]|nr:hypothetical protein [Desulfuromonadaceae bacterium]